MWPCRRYASGQWQFSVDFFLSLLPATVRCHSGNYAKGFFLLRCFLRRVSHYLVLMLAPLGHLCVQFNLSLPYRTLSSAKHREKEKRNRKKAQMLFVSASVYCGLQCVHLHSMCDRASVCEQQTTANCAINRFILVYVII